MEKMTIDPSHIEAFIKRMANRSRMTNISAFESAIQHDRWERAYLAASKELRVLFELIGKLDEAYPGGVEERIYKEEIEKIIGEE